MGASLIPAALLERLTPDDDPALWAAVLLAVAEDALAFEVKLPLYAEIGACSHWLRPHQSVWTAAGGFAAPEGYGGGATLRGLPQFDWSLILRCDAEGWSEPGDPPKKRARLVRLAIPARTARHRKAAVHALWGPGTMDAKHQRKVYYGLHKVSGGWTLAARSCARLRLVELDWKISQAICPFAGVRGWPIAVSNPQWPLQWRGPEGPGSLRGSSRRL